MEKVGGGERWEEKKGGRITQNGILGTKRVVRNSEQEVLSPTWIPKEMCTGQGGHWLGQ